MAIGSYNRSGDTFAEIEKKLTEMNTNLGRLIQKRVMEGSESIKDVKTEIEGLLGSIDEQIIGRADVKEMMISGGANAEKVKALILEVQEAVKRTIDEFIADTGLTKLGEKDAKELKTIYDEKVTKSDSVTTQANLEQFDSKGIHIRSTDEQIEDAKKEHKDLRTRLDRVAIYDKVADEVIKRKGFLKEEEARDYLKDKAYDEFYDGITATKSKIQQPVFLIADEYIDTYNEFLYKLKTTGLEKADVKELTNFIEELKKLKNPEIETLVNELEACANRTTDKDGKKVVTSYDSIKAKAALEKSHLEKVDFEGIIADMTKNHGSIAKKEVEELLKNDLLKLYPDFIATVKEKLEAGQIKDAFDEIESFARAQQTKFKPDVEQMFADSANKSKLESDEISAENRKKHLEDLSSRTTTNKTREGKIFGQTLAYKDKTTGRPKDIRLGSESAAVDALYKSLLDKIEKDETIQDKIDEEFESERKSLVAYKKPNIFRSIFYKLTHLGEKGGLNDRMKEDWIKEKIRSEVREMRTEQAKSWELSVEDAIKIGVDRERMSRDIKRDARKKIITDKVSAEDAIKDAEKEARKKQDKSSEDMTL